MIWICKVLYVFSCLMLSKFGHIICVVYVENGKSLVLNPDIKGMPEDILWTFNENKLSERDLSEFQDYGQFVNRTEIDISTGHLTVHNMTNIDTGSYKAIIQIDGKLQYFGDFVNVIDGVPEPQVTCELNRTSESRLLSCSVSAGIPVKFHWTGPNVLQFSQTLEIDKDEPSESVFICTVKNQVSQKNISIILTDCIKDGENHQMIIILVSISVFCVLLGALIIYLIYFRREKKEDTEATAHLLTNNHCKPLKADVNHKIINGNDDEQTISGDEECLHNDAEANIVIKDMESNTDEYISEEDPKTEDVQNQSKSATQLKNNTSKQKGDGHVPNEEQNTAQKIKEDEDPKIEDVQDKSESETGENQTAINEDEEQKIKEEEDPKTEDVQDKSKSATQLKNNTSKQKGDGHVPNEEQNTAQKIKEDEDPKTEDVQDQSKSATQLKNNISKQKGDGHVPNEEQNTAQKIKEDEDPKIEDVQDKSESATQLKNNTSKQKGDGHVPNEEQNTAQKIKEDEDPKIEDVQDKSESETGENQTAINEDEEQKIKEEEDPKTEDVQDKSKSATQLKNNTSKQKGDGHVPNEEQNTAQKIKEDEDPKTEDVQDQSKSATQLKNNTSKQKGDGHVPNEEQNTAQKIKEDEDPKIEDVQDKSESATQLKNNTSKQKGDGHVPNEEQNTAQKIKEDEDPKIEDVQDKSESETGENQTVINEDEEQKIKEEEDPKTEDVQDKSKSATQLKNNTSKQKGDGHVPNEEQNTAQKIKEDEDPKTEDVQDQSKSATQLKNNTSKQKGDGHVPNEEQNTAQKIKEDEDPKIEDVQDKSESETGENQTVINEDEEQKIKEEEDPKTEDVQDKSKSATQLKNNTSKQKGDGHVPNEEQNTAQKIKEDEDLCFRNNEGAVRTQDNKSNTDGNLSDKPRKTEEIQDQSEQRHESKYSEEVKNEEQEINKDRNKYVNTGEQKYRTKTDPQSDEHDNQQELDSDHQTQPIPDPAKEGFKCIREEHKENFEEEDKGGEESNTGKKESTNNSNSATCKQMTVKEIKEMYENNSQTPGPKSS